jgi:hypothetical protein
MSIPSWDFLIYLETAAQQIWAVVARDLRKKPYHSLPIHSQCVTGYCYSCDVCQELFFVTVYRVVCFVCFCLILYIIYFYCYVYVFLLLCMFSSVYSVFIVPTGTLRLSWLRFLRAFSSAVRQMPGYNSQRRGTARTLPNSAIIFTRLVRR